MAKLVPDDNIITDIGCDHAYLIIELFKLNKIKFAYAIDNKDGPIKNAIRNIDKYNLNDKCCIIKTNGLDFDFDKKIGTLIFADLGGRNAIKIIKNNIEKVQKIKYVVCDIRRNEKEFDCFLNFLNFRLDKDFFIVDHNKKYHLCRYAKI